MKPEITFEEFSKIDIRIGTITQVKDFPNARKPSYQLTIDFGGLDIKKSSAQITHLYSKEALLNKQILAVVNFSKKQIANFFSECLVLGIENSQKKIVLLQASKSNLKNGQPVN
ncbi:tRNA-binding protein [Lutibacter sp. B1]|uniref:tRNA-binding protein n=1 Tax=Lutibacter sp. B1 TaxID=2725996 RepID=UPI0014565BD7|nr:tRNA-binding protein [Lutibacter sp. B1]NLP56955.1 tRNA-binding protein [Lutibacter sp. B1]